VNLIRCDASATKGVRRQRSRRNGRSPGWIRRARRTCSSPSRPRRPP
jgi:hypothetical protein